MKYAIYNSKLGDIRIEYSDNTVTSLKKIHNKAEGHGEKTEFSDKVFKEVAEYFEGARKQFSFNFKLHGTEFQQKVWNALCDIPYGETRTYKDIAKAIGNEKASRAVGMANNKNPMHIVVPCHRVVGAGGKLVGYAGGLDMKEHLLNMESKHK